jgi:hypothetical protein
LPGYCNFFSVDEESLNNMIKTVIREHHWSPGKIENLYLDDADFFSLIWNYNDVTQHHADAKE